MTKKQTTSAEAGRPAPDCDIAQALEAQSIAENRPDLRWPLASVSDKFLLDISLGNLDLPEEGFAALDKVEVTAQTSIDLTTLAELELVRRQMSHLTGQQVPMVAALSELTSAYLAQNTRRS